MAPGGDRVGVDRGPGRGLEVDERGLEGLRARRRPQEAGAARAAEELAARRRQEVGADRRDVERHLADRLARVEDVPRVRSELAHRGADRLGGLSRPFWLGACVTATTFTRSSSIERRASTSRTPSASSGTASTVAPARRAAARIARTLLAYSACDTRIRSPRSSGTERKRAQPGVGRARGERDALRARSRRAARGRRTSRRAGPAPRRAPRSRRSPPRDAGGRPSCRRRPAAAAPSRRC